MATRTNTSAPLAFVPRLKRDAARSVLLRHLGTRKVGDRLPPIKVLARKLSVGESNLMLALQDLKRDGLIYSRRRVGTFVARPVGGQTSAPSDARIERAPTTHERDTRPLAGKRILLIVRAEPDGMIIAMRRAAQRAITDLGATAEVLETEMEHPGRWFSSAAADLAIAFNPPVPQGARGFPRLADEMASLPCPMIAVSSSWTPQTIGGLRWDLVGVDQEASARLAGEYLRRAGHTSACFVGFRRRESGQWHPTSAARLRGFEAGFGAPVPDQHCVATNGYGMIQGGRAVAQYMTIPDRPAAVFAVTDEVAVGMMVGASTYNLQAGWDFDLIGFDGLSLGRRLPEGPLTTVALPAAAMGRAAAAIAVDRLREPDMPARVVTLPCRVAPGATVRCPEEHATALSPA